MLGDTRRKGRRFHVAMKIFSAPARNLVAMRRV